jgi:type VI secretion system protein ImpE
MARGTTWHDVGEDTWLGSGQRMWVTDQGDYAQLDVRCIELNPDDVVAVTPPEVGADG